MMDFPFSAIAWQLLLAFRWTVGLSLIAFFGGGLVAALLLVARITNKPWLNRIIATYVQIFQGTPLLMQLFLTYFGLAMLGLQTSPLVAAAVCLTLYTSAFLCEIWRGCVEAIPKGQWEASSSLALNYLEQLRHVILPQAARIAMPPTAGFLVQVIKGTALASVIGFVEIAKAGQMMSNVTHKPFLIYGCVALLYFALCYPISLWSQHLEARLHRSAHGH
ncbi:amino acid ABC transporter permease [Corticibacter populi]|uniref:Amino acid ABC transporter permease n=1 Tax=Corticibacter populi TaxID=1550736 RepID=A0A3M6R097_9BURK|nr:amino acid ABC transporter permease [Corticibacter populi]RMX08670.1 amino acid ABC transporter permease [Corticibacter populi]RZS36007.1 amino acid ABC transporter membrane protein 2 (PAAT family) [Corticibacter populi]